MGEQSDLDELASIINNYPLASAIHRSIAAAQAYSFVQLVPGETIWAIFKRSLEAAIRDIETHPRGQLFRRLIQHGPYLPDDTDTLSTTSDGILSDEECGACVEFIYSHMVNRFKGELAELLALEPCLGLVQHLQAEGKLPAEVRLYWGETVRERRQIGSTRSKQAVQWGGFTKGADGLLVELIPGQLDSVAGQLRIHGVVEVKSMPRPQRQLIAQINQHLARLAGGVELAERQWPADAIERREVTRIMVVPSTWKLSREWQRMNTETGYDLVLPEPVDPPEPSQIEAVAPNLWKITLAWSQEALNQAGYEMTFWYMSQVGQHVFTPKNLPEAWRDMTPEAVGYNAIKMMLYYILLRPLSPRQERLAARLYNVYSFGYPLGVDSRKMLWPQDLK